MIYNFIDRPDSLKDNLSIIDVLFNIGFFRNHHDKTLAPLFVMITELYANEDHN
jgi:hypothetical protein